MLTKTERNDKIDAHGSSRAISTHLIQDEHADPSYFIRNTAAGISHFFSSRVSELYKSLTLAFSMDAMDWRSFRKYAWPAVTSGFALLLGEYLTQAMGQYQTESDEYNYIYKFLLGAAVLSYSILNRTTETRFTTTTSFSVAVAAEVVGITYMYSSVFNGTQTLAGQYLSEDYTLIAGLGTSALAVPAALSYVAQKIQAQLIRRQYDKGNQGSYSALISSGLTPAGTLYFQLGRFIAQELMAIPRLFQLGLIADNILYANHVLKRFRNLPALLADLTPATIKKILLELKKIEHDYTFNHITHRVLRFTSAGPQFSDVPRYLLRTGDLVLCDASIDLASVPLSGEIIALKRDEKGIPTQIPEQLKYSANLKAQNGEDVWIEYLSKPGFDSHYIKVDLHLMRDGKQSGVLSGDQLNLFGADNVFIQIKPAKELLLSNNYEKSSVINTVIAERKRSSVMYSILASAAMGAVLARDVTALPAETLRLMFTLFQTMIPFSEAFLRDTVNGRLMKKLNRNLENTPLGTIDALRVVDLCNALSGYYKDRFSQGVAIVSDKTGTLTTNAMDVLGLWTQNMPAEVQSLAKEDPDALIPKGVNLLQSFDVFGQAYTNNPKELEPEEYSILALFKSLIGEHCLSIVTLGNNHLKKTLIQEGQKREIQTYHLGLYRTFGGRLTLVDEGVNKYLVFCGIPKADSFNNTPLLQAYSSMVTRKAVLSRDWCVARTTISDSQFSCLKAFFAEDNKKEIESFIKADSDLLNSLVHHGTFIIDNPVKKGAEQFIGNCRSIHVPVFVATGDTTKAAENIAKVLCPENANKIISVRSEHIKQLPLESFDEQHIPTLSTVIFSGINQDVLNRFQKLFQRDPPQRPVVIFAEMSTEGKGILAQFLKDNSFFVVANGDGSNDVMMMKKAHMVIAHCAEEGSFAPGVEALSNVSDVQLAKLFSSRSSFYELFDIHKRYSRFIQLFAPLANSQEKPSFALAVKSSKLTFDFAKAIGLGAQDMFQQHWFSVAFDLTWLAIASHEIKASTDLPMDKRNISDSSLIPKVMGMAMVFGIFEALVNYAHSGESTNLVSMFLMLSLLPLVLKSIFSGFSEVQNRIYPEGEERFSPQLAQTKSMWGSLSTFFKRDHLSPRQLPASEGPVQGSPVLVRKYDNS